VLLALTALTPLTLWPLVALATLVSGVWTTPGLAALAPLPVSPTM